MKKLTLLLTFLILFTPKAKLLSQTAWEKYDDNPVLELGAPGTWDSYSTEMSSVIFIGDKYHMWYSGYDGINYRIGHAFSSDGITWTKDSLNPVLDIGMSGSWEDKLVYMACVIQNGSDFHMWYTGNDEENDRIGHATSQDGSNWTKDPTNPVIDLGPIGSWEDLEVFSMVGSVIFNGSTYQMWYGGGSSLTWAYATGYATSPDGYIWTKDTINNPVMVGGLPGEWDSQGALPGKIMFDGTKYQAWYSGCRNDYRYRIGYATSIDGITWVKDTLNNPILDFEPPGSWDHLQAWNSSVLFDSTSNSYLMWYTGGDFYAGGIGYATCLTTNIFDNNDLNHPSRFKSISILPNPFSTSTTIDYTLSQPQTITITFYNQFSKLVDRIEQQQSAGKQQVVWTPELPGGVYYFRLEAGEQTASGKLVLVR